VRFIRDGEAANQMSTHNIFAVFIVGEMSVTTALLKKLTAQGISVFLLNNNLRTKAAVMAEAGGNYLLREKQYACVKELTIAANIVANKINEQEKMLKKCKRTYDANVFTNARSMLQKVSDREQLLGIEGYTTPQSFCKNLVYTYRSFQMGIGLI